jgi:hypothetical protein
VEQQSNGIGMARAALLSIHLISTIQPCSVITGSQGTRGAARMFPLAFMTARPRWPSADVIMKRSWLNRTGVMHYFI